ncbi:hypothetical protein BVG19_g1334 [[Candida] boidinii]|nr:hypothetical protein BVG19_g1334 [[Candida] boidinii]OWB49041.1 hypothetical protein B5S27_g580 [[Candida] boidinii]
MLAKNSLKSIRNFQIRNFSSIVPLRNNNKFEYQSINNTNNNINNNTSNNIDPADELISNNNSDSPISNSNSNGNLSIQLPSINLLNDLKDKGIDGLYSKESLNEIWFNQSEFNLNILKNEISESKDLEDLFFSSSNVNYNNNTTTSTNSANAFSNNQASIKKSKKNLKNIKFGILNSDKFDNFQSTSLNQRSNPIDNSIIETSNKIIDQYYKFLYSIGKNIQFNNAFQPTSKIYNLFYFLSSIKPNNNNKIFKPSAKSLFETPDIFAKINNSPSDDLLEFINKSFGSLEEFKTLLLSSANSIKGNGYTWLMVKSAQNLSKYSDSQLVILNTYNNGSPHHFMGGQMASARKSMYGNDSADPMVEAEENADSRDFIYRPLLSIGSNPSFYLSDYGVFGKEQYLENVWNCIDWNIVNSRIPKK